MQQRASLNLLLLFLAIIHKASSSIYYVIPDDDNSSSYDEGTDYFNLQHYLNNTSEYFRSNNQFYFISGQYFISNDLVFKDIKNVSLIGNDHCVITCTSPASVLIINITSFVFKNIKLMNCTKSHKEYFNNMIHFDSLYTRDTLPSITVTQYHTSVFLYNSSSVIISDMNAIATVMKNFTAILILNIQGASKLINVKVHISSFNCITYNYPVQIKGIVVHHNDDKTKESELTINNFQHNNTYESCTNHIHCVFSLFFSENIKKIASNLSNS